MKKIFKYVLQIEDDQVCKMPFGASILSVQAQGHALCLWALVDEAAAYGDRRIRIVGTGNPFPDWAKCHYLGTAQIQGFVWHVFEKLLP